MTLAEAAHLGLISLAMAMSSLVESKPWSIRASQVWMTCFFFLKFMFYHVKQVLLYQEPERMGCSINDLSPAHWLVSQLMIVIWGWLGIKKLAAHSSTHWWCATPQLLGWLLGGPLGGYRSATIHHALFGFITVISSRHHEPELTIVYHHKLSLVTIIAHYQPLSAIIINHSLSTSIN